MRRVRLNRIQIDRQNGWVRKKRTRAGAVLAWAGNRYAWMTRERVRVLPAASWRKREAWMFQHLYLSPTRTESDGTLVMKWMGVPVLHLLQDPDRSAAFRIHLMGDVGRALARLHGTRFDGRWVSHADTSMANVTHDEETGLTAWIDFEMVHTPDLSTEERQADDLRGMLFTSLSWFPEPERGPAFQALMEGVAPGPVLLRTLLEQVRSPRLPLDTFHRAQVRLPDAEHENLTAFLIDRISRLASSGMEGSDSAVPLQSPESV
jgi:hypothetical protein